MIKVLILNTFDSNGGAAVAARRLNNGLRDIGIDSEMLVQFKNSTATDVIAPSSKLEKSLSLIRPELDSIPVKLYPNRERIIFSPGILPDRVANRIAVLGPDIVHLHWIAAGFIRIESLRHFNKPLVWTMHDSWAFTGGCHIPFDCKKYCESCGRCPALGSKKENDLSHWIWKRKKRAWKNLDLTIVTPSRWLAECARSSSLLSDFRIEVIPNGININRFKPINKQYARDILSLPKDKKIVLFGSMNCLDDRIKGFHLLVPALKKAAAGYNDEIELVIFGASKPQNVPDIGLKTTFMGVLHDDISLALLYAAADLLVAPYLQDNLPFTVMEAMACGTPCVAFDVGGVSDMIEHHRNGYLARPFESEDLAEGIRWVLDDEPRWKYLSIEARKKIENEFELKYIAQKYADLYNDILNNSTQQKK